MSWFNPLSWVGDKAGNAAGNDRSYAPGSKYSAGAGTTMTNAKIEAAKAKRVADGRSALPPVYANGAQVGPNQEGRGGAAQYAAPTISDQTGEPLPWSISDVDRKNLLAQQAANAGKQAAASQAQFDELGVQGQRNLRQLERQAYGADSVSAIQLRQGLQQNRAAQQSMVASARPQDSAGAARTASIQYGRAAAGMAGMQAAAGMQERNQAQANYSQALGAMRGQELNASVNARQTAANAYGANSSGAPTQSWWDKNGGQVIGGAAGFAAALSDERSKTGVRDGDGAARAATDKLGSYVFKYRDQKNGRGEQLGIMAGELEKAGLKQAVVNTPKGKVVHGAKLATANTAMIAALGRRLEALEGGGRQPAAMSDADARRMRETVLGRRGEPARAPATMSEADAQHMRAAVQGRQAPPRSMLSTGDALRMRALRMRAAAPPSARSFAYRSDYDMGAADMGGE